MIGLQYSDTVCSYYYSEGKLNLRIISIFYDCLQIILFSSLESNIKSLQS